MEFRAGTYDRSKLGRAARQLCPTQAVKRIQDIDPKALYSQGKRLLLLDIDNTFVPWRSNEIPDFTFAWLKEAKELGFAMCILSNTRHPERLAKLAKTLDVPFIRGKYKPNPAVYLQALEQFKARPEEAVMIGDQLFTDIWGANKCGIDSIWVEQISPKDVITTRAIRVLERLARVRFNRVLKP